MELGGCLRPGHRPILPKRGRESPNLAAFQAAENQQTPVEEGFEELPAQKSR